MNSYFKMRNPNTKYASTPKDSSLAHCCQHAISSYLTHLVLLHAEISKLERNSNIYVFSTGGKMHFAAIISCGKQSIQTLSAPALTQRRKPRT